MPNLKTLLPLVILLLSINYTYSQSQAELLEKAYQENSTELLKEFFCNWHQEVPPFSDAELLKQNDTIQQITKAFIAFFQPQNTIYQPHPLDTASSPQWTSDIYKYVEFMILPEYIGLSFVTLPDTLYSEQEITKYLIQTKRTPHRTDTIETEDEEGAFHSLVIKYKMDRFYPAICFDNKIPLFLTREYEKTIDIFLGNPPEFSGWYEVPVRSQQCIEKREEFLENYVKIFRGHWGGWTKCSNPQAMWITFDKNMKYAMIDYDFYFESGYQMCTAFLKKEEDIWTFISAEIYWDR